MQRQVLSAHVARESTATSVTSRIRSANPPVIGRGAELAADRCRAGRDACLSSDAPPIAVRRRTRTHVRCLARCLTTSTHYLYY